MLFLAFPSMTTTLEFNFKLMRYRNLRFTYLLADFFVCYLSFWSRQHGNRL